ncbi:uncharacterized protein LOC122304797 [Carya illinoinensis]|uniref:uncharacterized protein LOC122304797 n=1 Tax=Carya illinoinensis TaxID=32201 RepID=UPI001C71BC4D|nr:uncharacterized protein LOC122304797 [Carya illinoinensis]
MVFEGKFKGPCVLIQQAMQEVEAVLLAQEKQRENQTSPTKMIRTVWKPPSPGYLKVNVNAAVDSKRGKVGIGVVVRDFRGEVHVVVAVPRQVTKSASAAESLAMLHATLLCSELGIKQVPLEGDAKVVVEAINSSSYNSSWDGQVIEDIKAVVHAQLGWSVTFVGRDGNRAAHATAKLALSLSTECVWMEEVPTEVLPAVVLDLPSFVMSV